MSFGGRYDMSGYGGKWVHVYVNRWADGYVGWWLFRYEWVCL